MNVNIKYGLVKYLVHFEDYDFRYKLKSLLMESLECKIVNYKSYQIQKQLRSKGLCQIFYTTSFHQETPVYFQVFSNFCFENLSTNDCLISCLLSTRLNKFYFCFYFLTENNDYLQWSLRRVSLGNLDYIYQ